MHSVWLEYHNYMKTYQSISKSEAFCQRLVRDLRLFWRNPIDFLYSFTYSKHKKIKIAPYDPAVSALGRSLVARIQKKYPSLEVHFIGSPAHKIAGQRDIDLYVTCPKEHMARYVTFCSTLFGAPEKIRPSYIEWHTKIRSCEVEVIMGEKHNRIIEGPLAVYQILKKFPRLLSQYEKLKLRSNGVSEREYKRRRLEFFDDIYAQYREQVTL
jgi:GrpB-like predicted nucleotidyltransferase (UPF0157 family)